MSTPPEYETLEVFGPFHRRLSPTQDAHNMQAILRSGQLWGGRPQWNGEPQVKAFQGPLPDETIGFEFFTRYRPNRPYGHRMYWHPRQDGSVWEEDGKAKLQILISRVSQDIE